MYLIDGEIGNQNWELTGNFNMVLVNINQEIKSFTEFHFGALKLSKFLEPLGARTSELNLNSESTYIFESSY